MSRTSLWCVAAVMATAFCIAGSVAAADPNEEAVESALGLIGDQDKDVRALGLEQVREQAKGPEATRRFAAALRKLSPEAQVGLIKALTDRGDRAARPAMTPMLQSKDPSVRAAALLAVGSLGDEADVPVLVKSASAADEDQKNAALRGLVQMTGPKINGAILMELRAADVAIRAELLKVLVARRALDCIPSMLAAAADADADVRQSALQALSELCRADDLAAMVPLVLKAPDAKRREAAETAIAAICARLKSDQCASVLLEAYAKLPDHDKRALLPTLGRAGGRAILAIVEQAVTSPDPKLAEAGLRAMCNWPDSSVGPRLLELAGSAKEPARRRVALSGAIRVAPLPDRRPNAEKLDLLKTAMKLAARDDERKSAIKRLQSVRTMETLRYVASYLDDPALAQPACGTIVELAHHRDLRDPNKAEFDRLLDRVIAISKDKVVVERARRYKQGKTWAKGGGTE